MLVLMLTEGVEDRHLRDLRRCCYWNLLLDRSKRLFAFEMGYRCRSLHHSNLHHLHAQSQLQSRIHRHCHCHSCCSSPYMKNQRTRTGDRRRRKKERQIEKNEEVTRAIPRRMDEEEAKAKAGQASSRTYLSCCWCCFSGSGGTGWSAPNDENDENCESCESCGSGWTRGWILDETRGYSA
ncbi:hypothetical protein BD289DRAFT_437362 [Coniella lustricola]|uniref:Uncharacterized protein n=1 Tax=Coniella lustricola TaxID=2025994 RepID=A0A2T3A431_9PEZI|nr:hypothetical protein BD289DRAFT_437362 [Coniella lustricola]